MKIATFIYNLFFFTLILGVIAIPIIAIIYYYLKIKKINKEINFAYKEAYRKLNLYKINIRPLESLSYDPYYIARNLHLLKMNMSLLNNEYILVSQMNLTDTLVMNSKMKIFKNIYTTYIYNILKCYSKKYKINDSKLNKFIKNMKKFNESFFVLKNEFKKRKIDKMKEAIDCLNYFLVKLTYCIGDVYENDVEKKKLMMEVRNNVVEMDKKMEKVEEIYFEEGSKEVIMFFDMYDSMVCNIIKSINSIDLEE